MKKRKINLMLTCAGGATVPALVTHLRRSKIYNYRIVGIDAVTSLPATFMFDEIYQVPSADNPSYIEEIKEILKKENIDVIFAGSDLEIFKLGGITSELNALNVKLLASPPDVLQQISNKFVTYEKLRKAGLEVPEYRLCDTAYDVLQGLKQFGFPEKSVVLKPIIGRGGRGLVAFIGSDNPPDWVGSGTREKRVTDHHLSPEMVEDFISEPCLLMPCLSGPTFDTDVLKKIDGSYLTVVRKRHNPTGIPFTGNTIISDNQVSDYCKAVAKCLGLESLHDIDLMTRSDGRLVVIEVNPRPSGSLVSSLVAGFPLVDWAISVALDVECRMSEPTFDIMTVPKTGTFVLVDDQA